MSADQCHSLPANLSEKDFEPYKHAPWFILLHDAPRVDSRWKQTNAEKGEIFQYDPEATHDAEKNSEKQWKHSKSKKIIMGAIDSKRVKVEWASALFAPLSHDEKDLLLAIDSLKSRISTFHDSRDFLTFGRGLKEGDMVQVARSALTKSQKDDVHGKLQYKGPLMPARGFDPKGTYFGVELAVNCGSSNGVFKGTAYFRCLDDHAIFVPINKLIPVSRKAQPKPAKEEQCTRSSHTEGDMPKPSYFQKGDKVEVLASLKNPLKKEWIKGTVVTSKRHNGKMLIGVEVAQEYAFAINSNGFYKGKLVFSPKNPARTVLSEISDVRSCQSKQQKYEDDNNEERGPTETAVSNSADDGVWHKQESQKEQQALHDSKSGAHSSKSGSINHSTKEVEKPGPTPGRKTDSQPKIDSILDTTQQAMQNNLNKSSQTPPVITQPPSKEKMSFCENYYNTESGSEHTPVTHSGRNYEEQKKRKHTEQGKSLFSTIAANLPFRSVEQPSFPLDHWCLGQISIGGEKLLTNLAHDLQIKEADVIFRKGMDVYDTTSQLLRHWWEQLNEGHKAAFKELKNSLKKSGFRELVYFMEGGQPTDGDFHPSIVEVVVYKFGNGLPLLADKLGVRITAEKLPESVLGEQIFDIWQKLLLGPEKLSQLVRVIKEISREISKTREKEQTSVRKAEELADLALELEQGLSESVIRSISSTVPKEEWYQLGYSLGLSQLRLNAMERKFFSLSDRVFHVLRYWQMIQPYEVDQAEKLIVALQSCGLQENIRIISKGLDEERLLRVAESIGDDWKIFAGIVFCQRGIDHLIESTDRNQDKALSALRKWKRKQPATHKDLKKKLYEDLKKYKLDKAARMVLDGLDKDIFYDLARQVVFDWQPLAKLLDFDNYEIRKVEIQGYPEQSAYEMLVTWNETNDRDIGRKGKLCDALKQMGLENAAVWLKNTDEDIPHDDVNKDQGNNTQTTAKKPEPEVKSIDLPLLIEIAARLKKSDADLSILKEFLEISLDDTSKHVPRNVTFSSDPHLFILLVWRKKMRSLKKGTKEIGIILQNALIRCGLEDAADFISAGTPVDLQGAVGGSLAPETKVSKENLYVSSLVEFIWNSKTHHGTIQWIGELANFADHGRIAGIETEEDLLFGGNYELFRGRKYFDCEHGRGLFLPLSRCQPDSRFPTESQTLNEYTKTSKEDFGNIDCDPIPGYQEPQKSVSKDLIGQFKGIQGDHNSCYMDVTLYSMFAYSDIFDKILGWPKESQDAGVQLIKDHLRESIVNPLRSKGVVRADYILQFREMLNELSSMKGLRTEEKDPEEFIHTLLQELLNAEPFLKISQGNATTMESFVYQIFLEKNDFLKVPTVEQLVHLSFLESDLKLMEVPNCFIVQLPRFGKQFKLYDWIIPSLEMDITPIVKNSTRQCSVCGQLALQECKDCRPKIESEDIIQSFCGVCWKQKHQSNPREKLSHHAPVTLSCTREFMARYVECTHNGADPTAAQDIYDSHKMELFSVMCIETSHYVAFVKTGSGQDSQWVFFDSMADRRGDHRGYNVPEVTHIRSFKETVESKSLIEDLSMPNFPSCLKRLFGDAYICFYRLVSSSQSPTHGSKGIYQGNLVEAFQGNVQKAHYGKEGYHSSANPSDVDMLDSLKSENLLTTPVFKPPSTEMEASAVMGEPMEVDTTHYPNVRLPPNVSARSRRWEASSTGTDDSMARGYQSSENTTTYTSRLTYNLPPNPQSVGNVDWHEPTNINSSHRGSEQPDRYEDGREKYV
ncbi:Ubiquitin carboxyl-terminal hydrolase CYLD [Holothuria leucospilota]|uniref:ubiquitinyl hydrolase 1 n=1 Tax=Holothuria leucospilota TaxID=206669 RepID=A0A9Q1HCZ3_HOLLE|nr:Ubiquitin carboxyl-terminal hydrolase CYLD [Holothuria leucospilota]